jgi:hypothetical protein
LVDAGGPRTRTSFQPFVILSSVRQVASVLIPVTQTTSIVEESAMPNLEPRCVFEIPSTADDGIADYDDGRLGCEAMIGGLNINHCRPKYEANFVKSAHS